MITEPCFPLDAPGCALLGEAVGCACLLAGQSELTDLSWSSRSVALNKKAVLQSCEQINKSLSVWKSGMGGLQQQQGSDEELGHTGKGNCFHGTVDVPHYFSIATNFYLNKNGDCDVRLDM